MGMSTILASHSIEAGTLQCAACVCTVPLGVLKNNSIVFEPPLPEDKQAAIHRLGMALLNKVAIRFDSCFWQCDKPTGSEEAEDEPHAIARIPLCSERLLADALESPYMV